jgi:nitric oxide reductase subunit C
LFFFLVFIGLTAHSHYYVVTTSTDHAGLTDSVKHGKEIWEKNSCINCHSLLGEGAYFAPELGNVWLRYGGDASPQRARIGLKAWIRVQPTGAPGRRQMPAYDFTEEELDALIDFLEWTSRIDTQGWPPNIFG